MHVLICYKPAIISTYIKPSHIGVVGLFDSYEKAIKAISVLQDKFEFRGMEFHITPVKSIEDPEDERSYNWPLGYMPTDLSK